MKKQSMLDYEGFATSIGSAGMRLLFEIVDQASLTQSLPQFQADPFGLALEEAVTMRLGELGAIWPNLSRAELLRKAKEYAGRVAAHNKSIQGKSSVLATSSRRRRMRNWLVRRGQLSPSAPPNFCPPVSTS